MEQQLSKTSIEVIKTQDSVLGTCYRLNTPKLFHGATFLNSRLFTTEAEAQIAAGLATIRIKITNDNLDYNEYNELLKSMLRLAYSSKIWSTD